MPLTRRASSRFARVAGGVLVGATLLIPVAVAQTAPAGETPSPRPTDTVELHPSSPLGGPSQDGIPRLYDTPGTDTTPTPRTGMGMGSGSNLGSGPAKSGAPTDLRHETDGVATEGKNGEGD